PAEDAIVSRYPPFKARQSHWGGAALARLRDEAFTSLKAHGLPTRRVEEWKYTDLRALMRDLPEPFEGLTPEMERDATAMRPSLSVAGATRILFVNGELVGSARDRQEGLVIESLKQRRGANDLVARKRSYTSNAAVTLNTAFMGDCVVLRIPVGTTLQRPLHLEFRELG